MKSRGTMRLIYYVFITTFFVFTVFFSWIYFDFTKTAQLAKSERLTQDMLDHLDNLNTSITFIERDEKPYLIQKNVKVANEISYGYNLAFHEIDSLKRICQADRSYYTEICMMDSILTQKHTFSNQLIELSKKGKPDSAIYLLTSAQDSTLVNGFVNIYNLIYSNLSKHLRAQEQQHTDTTESAVIGLFFIIATTIGFLAFSLWRIRKQFFDNELLNRQNRIYADIIEQSFESITISDTDLNITFCNMATEKLYRIPREKIIGRNLDQVFRSRFSAEEVIAKKRSLEEHGFWMGEISNKDAEGNNIDLYTTVNAIRDHHNKITGYFAINTDITSLKGSQQEVQRLAANLQQANKDLSYKVAEQTSLIKEVFERINEIFIATDEHYRITYINDLGIELLGFIQHDLVGQNLLFFLQDKSLEMVRECIKESLSSQEHIYFDFLYTQTESWYEVNIYPSLKGLSLHFKNITQRKLMSIQQKHFNEIIENTAAFVGRVDKNNRLLYANNALRTALELDLAEDVSKYTVVEFLSSRAMKIEDITGVLFKDGKWIGENYIKSLSGKEIPVLQVVILHRDENGKPSNISTTAINLTGIKNAEKELRDLSNHLQNISEIERKRIARDIHDELGQYLTAMKMGVSWIQKHIHENRERVESKLAELKDIVMATIESFRKIHSSLHPAMLEDVGLFAAVEWYCNTASKYGNIPINLHSNMERDKININISLPLYRVIQESITNILRYANASQVNIELNMMEHKLVLLVADNGKGFDSNAVDTKLHHGILGMRERIYALDGLFVIHSVPGQGTRIEVEIPIQGSNGYLSIDAPDPKTKATPLSGFCGPDGTRTRDLRRDRAAF